MNKLLLAAAAVAALIAAPAQAIVVAWDGTGASDTIDWGQLGASFTLVPSGTNVVSNNGLSATVADTVGSDSDLERRDQGDGWFGSFAPGERLLFTGIPGNIPQPGSIFISFAAPVRAAGAQIQGNFPGAYTARITTDDGSFFEILGVSALGSPDDSNPFLGAISDSASITSILFTVPVNGSAGFAISQLDLVAGNGVPEPASWAMMIVGFGAVGGAMRAARRNPKTAAA